MASKKLEITHAFKKHFDQADFIRFGPYNRLYLSAGDFSWEVDISEELIDTLNPYDIVNDIWSIIYANFSKWRRI